VIRPSIELFTRHWRLEGRRPSTRAEFWDGRADSFQNHKETVNIQRRRDFVTWLAGKCGLGPGGRVLDLGCGTGHYSMLWAEWADEVQGFDLSPKMIALAEENARRAGPGRKIKLRVLDWREADPVALAWEKRFDLSFACRTPAICDQGTLDKMLAVTRGFGVLVGLAGQSGSLRDDLKKFIHRPDESIRAARSVYSAFNLLWLQGFFPEISYFTQHWVERVTLEEAVSLQSRGFESHGPLTDDEVGLIAGYLQSRLVNGLIEEEVTATSAVLIWNMNP
jgi:SAM-dependent methyltransferase